MAGVRSEKRETLHKFDKGICLQANKTLSALLSTEEQFKAESLKESQRHLVSVTTTDKSHEITPKRRKKREKEQQRWFQLKHYR